MFKIIGNMIDASYGNFNLVPSKNGCYIKNCIIKPRKNDKLFSVVDDGMNSWLVPTLDNYAIIPRDEFNEYVNWKNRRKNIRVLNGGK